MFIDVILRILAHARTHAHTHHVRITVQSTQYVSMANVTVDAATCIPHSKLWHNVGQ
jgi:hypothetical protein